MATACGVLLNFAVRDAETAASLPIFGDVLSVCAARLPDADFARQCPVAHANFAVLALMLARRRWPSLSATRSSPTLSPWSGPVIGSSTGPPTELMKSTRPTAVRIAGSLASAPARRARPRVV